MEKDKLFRLAQHVRYTTLQLSHNANESHTAGALSMADVIVTLYVNYLNNSPALQDTPERDRFIDTRCIATSNSKNRQPLASQSDFNRIPKESFASFGITVPVNRNFSSGCSRKPYEVVPHPSSSTVVSPYSL